MAELRDAALLLRSIPYREHSSICHVLTASHGRLALLVHGARGKRRQGRQAELASMYQLSIRWRPGRGELGLLLDVSREAALLPEAYWVYGQPLTAMANELFREHGQQGYDELLHAYHMLAGYRQASTGLLAAQWDLLLAAGWAAPLNACWQCGTTFVSGSPVKPLWQSGQLHCSRCSRGVSISLATLLSILAAQASPEHDADEDARALWAKMRDSVLFHIHHG